MDLYQNQLTKYDIPLSHLDHEYIKKCDNVSELEKIIKILRSHHEGYYPDLERLAEERLVDLKPKSKLLWKADKLLSPKDLNEDERTIIDTEIKEWEENVKSLDEKLRTKTLDLQFDSLPPVRGLSNAVTNNAKKENSSTPTIINKKVKPREYAEWDKLDIDAELKKVDEDKFSKIKKPSKLEEVDTMENLEAFISDPSLPDELKTLRAEREKNKGNEAFKAGDYDEALLYYGRSISIEKNVPAYNNRAQIYLNKKKWNQALDDCDSVMSLDPSNVKAHMRRAVAYKGITQYTLAQKDIRFVLQMEPGNKQAKSVLKEVKQLVADQKIHGRRMEIEEVEGSDDDDDGLANKELNGCGGLVNMETASAFPDKGGAGDCGEKENRKFCNDSLNAINGETLLLDTNGTNDVNEGGDATERVKARLQDDPTFCNDSTIQFNSSAPSSNISSHQPFSEILSLWSKAEEMFKVGQYGEAANVSEEALQLFNGYPQSKEECSAFESLLLKKAESSLKMGDISGCINDCDALLRFSPNSPRAMLRKAIALEERENYKEAYICYKAVLSMDSDCAVAQKSSNRCALALNNLLGSDWRNKLSLPISVSLISDISSISQPESSSELHPTSDCQELSIQPSANIKSSSDAEVTTLESTLLESSNTVDELYEQFKATGNNLFSKGEYQEAISCFTKCIELKNNQVVPYTNRALCYLKINEYDLVLDDCNQALIIDFHCAKALYRRALSFKMKGEFDKSLIDLETLLKIDPGNSAAKKEINNINNTMKQIKEKKLMEACLRKEKKRQRINILDIDSGSHQQVAHKCLKEDKTLQPKTSKKSSMPTIASFAKTTTTKSVKPEFVVTKVTSPFEFMQAYNSARFSEDLSAYVAVFDALDPSNLPKVMSNKLESEMLVVLVKCLKYYLETGKKNRAKQYLENILLVERFDMVSMFLSDSDKKEVNEMIEMISQHFDQEFVDVLKMKFRV